MTTNSQSSQPKSFAPSARSAFTFVFTLGIVSLFADMTYEGGASINGQFMGSLGATAAIISITAGVGEFLGYTLRLASGYFGDRIGNYWLFTFIGYTINLFAVPAMAFASSWEAAAALILAERIGRAIRKPSVEAMLSYTTGTLGRGWVYGFHTALDETGATLGPLLMSLVLFRKGSYSTSYSILLIPAVLSLISLCAARWVFPVPAKLEFDTTTRATRFTRSYLIYMLAAACFGAGLMSFEMISFHLASTGVVSDYWIPIMVAIATIASITCSLFLGRLYDRVGLPVILGAIACSAMFSPLVFFGGFSAIVVGMTLWGIGYCVQDSLLKALVAGLLPEGRRSLAFGLFSTGYGVGWLIGSVVTGLLYEKSPTAMIAFVMAAQLISLPLFLLAMRAGKTETLA